MLKRFWMVMFLLSFSATSHATTLTFEDYKLPGSGTTSFGTTIVDQGFTFYGISLGGMDNFYLGQAHSGNNVLESSPFFATVISSIGGIPFSVQDCYMMSTRMTFNPMVIIGYLNGESTGGMYVNVDESWRSEWHQVAINFENIDRLVMLFDVPMLIDDLRVNDQAAAVPEPGTIMYLAAGVGILYFVRRTRLGLRGQPATA
jgi:hypothetical protein